MNNTVPHILIVEDEASHAMAIRRSLEIAFPDARIEVMASIREFRESIAAGKPSIAILDLNLSDGCSIDLLTAPGDASFPVIIMTSHGSEQVAVDAIKAGALDYIVKSSASFSAIAGTVERTLREWNLLQEKRRMEKLLMESQAQIIHQEKMASIGQLAAGVAHEINNPIGFINSNLGSLGKYQEKLAQYITLLEDTVRNNCDAAVAEQVSAGRSRLKIDYISRDLRQLIEESIEGTERVKKIVQDLKTFSRAGEIEMCLADINQCLDSTINIVWNELKYVATLNKEFGELPALACHPQQINQVCMNLLVNAAHAIVGQGIITVRTWADDNAVYIAVSDTGRGIPQENLKKIFDAFYTTKEIGKGTGLGLSISAEIVKKHGGTIMVASEVGQGSTFTIRLPIRQQG